MLAILETMVGLVFVLTLVSLVCSVVVEWLSGILSVRGKNLHRGMVSMLGQDLAQKVWNHPLLKALRRESWLDSIPILRRFRSEIEGADPDLKHGRSAYIPKETFTTALLAVIAGQPPADVTALRSQIRTLVDVQPKEALSALVADAPDLEKAKERIQAWFEATMDRVGGWYKRWAQLALLIVGFLVAFLVGVDSVAITRALWANPDLRKGVADAAAEYVEANQEKFAAARPEQEPSPNEPTAEQVLAGLRDLTEDLQAQRLPLFPWGQPVVEDSRSAGCFTVGAWWKNLRLHLLGFFLTALAATLGAQFWFDLLTKLVKLRAAGSPPEKTDSKKGGA